MVYVIVSAQVNSRIYVLITAFFLHQTLIRQLQNFVFVHLNQVISGQEFDVQVKEKRI